MASTIRAFVRRVSGSGLPQEAQQQEQGQLPAQKQQQKQRVHEHQPSSLPPLRQAAFAAVPEPARHVETTVQTVPSLSPAGSPIVSQGRRGSAVSVESLDLMAAEEELDDGASAVTIMSLSASSLAAAGGAGLTTIGSAASLSCASLSSSYDGSSSASGGEEPKGKRGEAASARRAERARPILRKQSTGGSSGYNVRFEQVNPPCAYTHAQTEYERGSDPMNITAADAFLIRDELAKYKMFEMVVHTKSVHNTHFYNF